LSEIRIFSFNFAPRGWALCNGQLLAINSNQAIFALLGTTYGGNGVNNFALPNLQGCVPVHQGTLSGNPSVIGQQAGAVNVTLNINQIASHTHVVNANSGANADVPTSAVVPGGGGATAYGSAPGGTTMNNAIVGNAGGSQAHNNMQPTLVLNFCIATSGIFPSRN